MEVTEVETIHERSFEDSMDVSDPCAATSSRRSSGARPLTKIRSTSSACMDRPLSASSTTLTDEIEAFTLPPGCEWLAQAISLPGAEPLDDQDGASDIADAIPTIPDASPRSLMPRSIDIWEDPSLGMIPDLAGGTASNIWPGTSRTSTADSTVMPLETRGMEGSRDVVASAASRKGFMARAVGQRLPAPRASPRTQQPAAARAPGAVGRTKTNVIKAKASKEDGKARARGRK